MTPMATPPRKVSMLWPDPTDGPWVIDIWWRVQYGSAAPVGIALRAWAPGTESKREQTEEGMWDAVFLGKLRRNDDDEAPQYAVPSAEDEVEFPALTSSLLRALPLGQLLEAAREELTERFDFSGLTKETVDSDLIPWTQALAAKIEEWGAQAAPELEGLGRRRGGRDLGDAHYDEVARVYRESLRDAGNPTSAVASHFTISKSAAAKKVSRARDRGFLPPTTQGRVGRLSKDL